MKRVLGLAVLMAALAGPAISQTAAPAAPTVAAAPDYAQDAAWLCRPGRQDACAVDQDVTVITAAGKRSVTKFVADPAPKFDCFYVYPTVSLDPTPNSDLVIGTEERAVAASQAARFAQHCRVFAPMYRQVTLTALRDVIAGKPFTADRKMAYDDVVAAWRQYMAKDNKGRGVVLIGHSQGSGVLKQLLADVIEKDPAMRGKVIAAYLAGTNVAVPPGGTVGGDLKVMPLCTKKTDTGCVVAWVTFRADAPPPANSRFGKVPTAGMVAACVNAAQLLGGATNDAILGAKGAGLGSTPMGNWTSDGAVVTTPFVAVPGLISTQCVSKDGFSYLALTVNADPKDPRTDTIVGDVVLNGVIAKDWGLHLIDMPSEMGDLVKLSDVQARAWMAAQPKK